MLRARVVGVLLALLLCPPACDDEDDSGGTGTDAADTGSGDSGGSPDVADTGGDQADVSDAESDPPEGTGDGTLPERFLLTGSADETDAETGERGVCTLFGAFFDVEATADGWTALIDAGEVIREFHYDAPIPSTFQALMAGEVSLTEVGDGVELRWVGEQPDDTMDFWLALEVMEGTEVAPFTYEGTFDCAPANVEGSADATDLVVEGTWTLEPEAP